MVQRGHRKEEGENQWKRRGAAGCDGKLAMAYASTSNQKTINFNKSKAYYKVLSFKCEVFFSYLAICHKIYS
jgi:hypothetical protein